MICRNCGCQLTESQRICPKCGTAVHYNPNENPKFNTNNYNNPGSAKSKTDNYAIASLVLGIVGILLCPTFIGLPLGVIGIIMFALIPDIQSSKKIGIAGLVTSLIAMTIGSGAFATALFWSDLLGAFFNYL